MVDNMMTEEVISFTHVKFSLILYQKQQRATKRNTSLSKLKSIKKL